MFIYAAFEFHTESINESAPPITTGTSHGLNCFRHMTYDMQIEHYQNIAKLLPHPHNGFLPILIQLEKSIFEKQRQRFAIKCLLDNWLHCG